MGAKILVVDDSAIVRQMHAFMLRSAGFEVAEAENGAEALEAALSERFDLILTDINMPVMDGYELTRRLRQMPEYTSTPIVIVSTESEAQDKTLGFEAGANLYIVKPAQRDQLVSNINLILAAANTSS